MNKSIAAVKPIAQRIMKRCDELGAISSMSNGVCRTYLTSEHRTCNNLVHQWMRENGMQVWEDSVGNCWGRIPAATNDAPSIIIGSHLDTIPNAGKYDGILGVLSGIEVAKLIADKQIALPFNLDIVGFGDEEGVRFGATLIGSRAVAGTWDDTWMELVDQSKTSLNRALIDFKGTAVNPKLSSRTHDKILAYLELHIEQGPVLEQQKTPVGVVSAIAGARRFELEYEGFAGHAGTVPMDMRRDALIGAARAINTIESIACRNKVVATVGKIQAFPGSVNVIPGKCTFTLDIRSGVDKTRDIVVAEILEELQKLAEALQLAFSFEEIHNASAVACDSGLQRHIEEAIEEIDIDPLSLVSGAGHDAMAINDIAPVGMIFVRCLGGISHHPAESVTVDDVACGVAALHGALLKLIHADVS